MLWANTSLLSRQAAPLLMSFQSGYGWVLFLFGKVCKDESRDLIFVVDPYPQPMHNFWRNRLHHSFYYVKIFAQEMVISPLTLVFQNHHGQQQCCQGLFGTVASHLMPWPSGEWTTPLQNSPSSSPSHRDPTCEEGMFGNSSWTKGNDHLKKWHK